MGQPPALAKLYSLLDDPAEPLEALPLTVDVARAPAVLERAPRYSDARPHFFSFASARHFANPFSRSAFDLNPRRCSVTVSAVPPNQKLADM